MNTYNARKLASIQSIKEIKEIKGKDRIGLASFEGVGWKVIVNKTEYVPGDLCCYIEANSILPLLPEFEFLKSRCFSNKYNGYKIHCMKMSNCYSFGIVFPLSTFKNQPFYNDLLNLKDGDDCTELLGVLHKDDERFDENPNRPNYAPKPKSLWQKIKRWIFKTFFGYHEQVSEKRPSIIRQTDETRVENLNFVWSDEFKSKKIPMYLTLKMDGQSASYAIIRNKFYVTSRNMVLFHDSVKNAVKWFAKNQIHKHNIISMVTKYDILNKLIQAQKDLKWKDGILIQGEVFGPGIQKNKMGASEVQLNVFNLIQIKKDGLNKHYSNNSIFQFCMNYGIPAVPIIGNIIWGEHEITENIDTLREFVKGLKYENDQAAEGMVIRQDKNGTAFSDEDVMNWNTPGFGNQEISFKCISPDYFIKND